MSPSDRRRRRRRWAQASPRRPRLASAASVVRLPACMPSSPQLLQPALLPATCSQTSVCPAPIPVPPRPHPPTPPQMRLAGILWAALLLLGWAALEVRCANPAIVGGQNADPNRYHYAASLRTSDGGHGCGGERCDCPHGLSARAQCAAATSALRGAGLSFWPPHPSGRSLPSLAGSLIAPEWVLTATHW